MSCRQAWFLFSLVLISDNPVVQRNCYLLISQRPLQTFFYLPSLHMTLEKCRKQLTFCGFLQTDAKHTLWISLFSLSKPHESHVHQSVVVTLLKCYCYSELHSTSSVDFHWSTHFNRTHECHTLTKIQNKKLMIHRNAKAFWEYIKDQMQRFFICWSKLLHVCL